MSGPQWAWTSRSPTPWKYIGGGVVKDNAGEPAVYLAGRLNNGNADQVGSLIAAAPELYAALVDVISVSDRKTDEYDRAKAALAKARGEQP